MKSLPYEHTKNLDLNLKKKSFEFDENEIKNSKRLLSSFPRFLMELSDSKAHDSYSQPIEQVF